MAPVVLQIKSNAAGLPDNGLACYGIFVEVYDTGSIHHRADATVSAFDIPTGGGGKVAASVVLRSQSPIAANGLTGYTLSWQYNTDGSKTITCYSWQGGVQTQVGTDFTGGTKTPVAGDVFSGSIAGSTITAFVNGQAVPGASFVDTTITTGSYAGVHFYRNIATSNCYFTQFAAYLIPPPVIVTGNRNAKLYPMSTFCPFNIAMHDGATFGSLVSSGAIVNTNHFGCTLEGFGYTEPAQTDNVENHRTVLDVNGVAVRDFIGPGQGTQNGLYTINGTGINAGTGAARIGRLAGLLRTADFDQNAANHPLGVVAINHALNIFLPYSKLSAASASDFVWPANGVDSAWTSYGGGGIKIGMRLAIPPGTTMPAGLSADGQMYFHQGVNYGLYVTNTTAASGAVILGESNFAHGAPPASVQALYKVVTNASQANPGGPGNFLPGTALLPLVPGDHNSL